MSLSKLKTLAKPFHHHHLLRLLFTTPESAAAARRHRNSRLHIKPPSLHHSQPPKANPNAPKLPDHISSLTGKKLQLHNTILTLIRENDVQEASSLTRHSVYSNCKPTIFTCNAVLNAFLLQSRFPELLELHRFILQAGIAPNIVTCNILINGYFDNKKVDTAMEYYKQLVINAPFEPTPGTFRIVVKGLVENSRVERAVEVKDEMIDKGLGADAVVYDYLMLGFLEKGDGDKALGLFGELKEKMGFVDDGVVYGNLMKALFLKGMEKEAMECYDDVVGEKSRVRLGAGGYNSILQALNKNGKFEEGLMLFDRMMREHSYPMKLMVNLDSFNVMVDAFCEQRSFDEAIEVFKKMGEKRCSPDTFSVNNLIDQLCRGGMVAKAEEIYREMGEGSMPVPDEHTYVLMMDACFEHNRADDAAGYFNKMVESGLKPGVDAYTKVVEGLIKVGKIDEANGFFIQMIEGLKVEAANYEVMLRALCEASKLDEVLELVGRMLRDERVGLSLELNEVVKDALGKEGREDDLVKAFEEKEREDREKAEALIRKAEEEKAAAAAAALKDSARSASTFSLMSRTISRNGGLAFGENISVNGNTPTGNQEGPGEAVSGDASPAVGAIEEAMEANGMDEELKTSDGGTVEEVTV